MSSWRSFCHAVHISALGLWAGATVIAGATAAIAFPTLKALHATVPGLKTCEQDGFRFAAGAVAQNVFAVAEMVGLVCATAAAVTLLVLMLTGALVSHRWSTYLRGLALGIAMACVASMVFVVSPRINSAAAAHLEAAQGGDEKGCATARAAVDDLHPIASALLGTEVIAAMIALLIAASQPLGESTPPARSTYPEPSLLRTRR